MTQPESRTVEERFIDALGDAWKQTHGGNPSVATFEEFGRFILAAAKEHGLVIGEGELDGLHAAEALLESRAYDTNDECRWCHTDIEDEHLDDCAVMIVAERLRRRPHSEPRKGGGLE